MLIYYRYAKSKVSATLYDNPDAAGVLPWVAVVEIHIPGHINVHWIDGVILVGADGLPHIASLDIQGLHT